MKEKKHYFIVIDKKIQGDETNASFISFPNFYFQILSKQTQW